jgi:hypothetical protein
VGTITGGTNSLVLVSNPGFQIGDHIIIAVGGEAGAGMRGTKGVGGNWPATSYVDTATLLAASPAEGTRAWDVSTGKVWYRGASVWEDLSGVTSLYYTNRAVPLALTATITNVVGTTLTLDTNANVTATAANVYFDNAAILNAAWGASGTYAGIENLKWHVPAIFPISVPILIYAKQTWVIEGVGMDTSGFRNPDGAVGYPWVYDCDNVLVRDLGVIGNVADNGFGVQGFGTTDGADFVHGILFTISTSCIALRCKSTDVFYSAVGGQYCVDTWAIECVAVRTAGVQSYTQWQFGFADCYGGGLLNCEVDSPHLTAGPETFRSSRFSIIGGTFRNTLFSSNSSGSYLLKNVNIIINANSQLSEVSIPATSPIIQFNSNIQPPNAEMNLGAKVVGVNITVEGHINADRASLIYCTINESCPNVAISGDYPDGVSPRGHWQGPNYGGVPANSFSGIFVRNAGTGTVVRGMRFKGDVDFANGKSSIHQEGGSVTSTNNVMDNGVGGVGTIVETGTQTNAEWELSH